MVEIATNQNHSQFVATDKIEIIVSICYCFLVSCQPTHHKNKMFLNINLVAFFFERQLKALESDRKAFGSFRVKMSLAKKKKKLSLNRNALEIANEMVPKEAVEPRSETLRKQFQAQFGRVMTLLQRNVQRERPTERFRDAFVHLSSLNAAQI